MNHRVQIVFIFLIFIASLIYYHLALANQNYQVSAEVETPISQNYSKVQLSSTDSLANPSSHSIILTVYLNNKKNQPVSGRQVKVLSKRSVDIIESTKKLINQAEDLKTINSDYSDDNGKASFRVSSFVPGDSEIYVVADSVVHFEPVKISFQQLPFPVHLNIKLKVPLVENPVNILSANYNKERLSRAQVKSAEEVKPETVVYIPGWVFLIMVIVVLSLLYFQFIGFKTFYKNRIKKAY